MTDRGLESRTTDLAQLTLSTNNDGLDKLLKGGFKLPKSGDGLVLLIKGKPGTGKSTLALQIAESISKQLGKGKKSKDDWFFFTCEQKKEDISEKACIFGYNIDEKHILDKRDLDNLGTTADSLQALTQSTLMWVTNTVNKFLLGNAKDDKKQKNVVVIDGLNLMNFDERIRFNMDWLISVLRKYCHFSILVYESLEGEKSQIDSMVDIIIQLKGEEIVGPPPYYQNKLCIMKSRFQGCVLGWHQYKIVSGRGLVVFPSIHYYIHKTNFLGEELKNSEDNWYKCISQGNLKTAEDRMIEGDSIISTLLHKKISRGSFTVLLGPRKTCKSLLSLDYLKEGSRKGKNGLLISLIDNRETILNTATKRYPMNKKTEKEIQDYIKASCINNYLFHFRPGCISSSEFFNNLSRLLNNRNLNRVVFWDLTQIDLCYPLIASDDMFFTAMYDYLKIYKNAAAGVTDTRDYSRGDISTVVIGSDSCKLAKSAFTMSDNVILLQRDESSQENCIYAYVDRVEGQPGVNYLWKIPLIRFTDGENYEIFETPLEIGYDKQITERFQHMIRHIEYSK